MPDFTDALVEWITSVAKSKKLQPLPANVVKGIKRVALCSIKELPVMTAVPETPPARRAIIFLDIDGVLVTYKSIQQSGSGYRSKPDTNCVAELNRITDATQAEIVISSTWRLDQPTPCRLREWGVTGKLIGRTPRLEHTEQRGAEISEYIKTLDKRPAAICILDDNPDMLTLGHALVLTSMSGGLTKDHADHAIAMIERQLASVRSILSDLK